jgi:serine/threonine-protein kinase RsbW
MATASWNARALPEEVRPLRNAVAHFLAAHGIEGEVLADVRLAVSEAVSNAVTHAYAGGDPGPISVEVAITEADVHVAIRDEGGGLRPRPDSPGAGLGLPVMGRLATEIAVAARPQGGTEVLLRFGRFVTEADSLVA